MDEGTLHGRIGGNIYRPIAYTKAMYGQCDGIDEDRRWATRRTCYVRRKEDWVVRQTTLYLTIFHPRDGLYI